MAVSCLGRAVAVVAMAAGGALAVGCAAPGGLPAARFANAPPVTIVDDRRGVPTRPDISLPLREVDVYDRSFAGPLFRALELPTRRRALGVNAVDEVPDSTWFTNRIGVRELSPAEIARGPLDDDDGAEPPKPWTVRSTWPRGGRLGLLITDAHGVAYGISFDHRDRPELETGAAIVVNRLLWASGYNVPADRIAYVRPSELVLAPDATIKNELGRMIGLLERPDLDAMLAEAWQTRDGRIRVHASRRLAGEPLGGTPPAGTRRGDPNDRIPHQHRRDLRGQYPLFAWLDHVDLVQANFLDQWITSPRDPARRYVVHYQLGSGKSLGAMALTAQFLRSGHSYAFDWGQSGWSLITLGLAPRPWGRYVAPPLTGVAPTFVPAGFDPGAWRPILPYAPFDAGDRFDMFWGTKLLARFTPAQIRAAVEAGQFSDPRAVTYLTNTLIARQRATVAYWYARVNPLDRFTIAADALCFDDLAIAAGLAPAAGTRYELASHDRHGNLLDRAVLTAAASGPTCTRTLTVSATGDGYTIVEVTTVRPTFAGSTLVHIARAPDTGTWRVIGVWRR